LLEEINATGRGACRGVGRNGQQADKNEGPDETRAEETENPAVSAEATGGRRILILEPELIVRKTSLVQ